MEYGTFIYPIIKYLIIMTGKSPGRLADLNKVYKQLRKLIKKTFEIWDTLFDVEEEICRLARSEVFSDIIRMDLRKNTNRTKAAREEIWKLRHVLYELLAKVYADLFELKMKKVREEEEKISEYLERHR